MGCVKDLFLRCDCARESDDDVVPGVIGNRIPVFIWFIGDHFRRDPLQKLFHQVFRRLCVILSGKHGIGVSGRDGIFLSADIHRCVAGKGADPLRVSFLVCVGKKIVDRVNSRLCWSRFSCRDISWFRSRFRTCDFLRWRRDFGYRCLCWHSCRNIVL